MSNVHDNTSTALLFEELRALLIDARKDVFASKFGSLTCYAISERLAVLEKRLAEPTHWAVFAPCGEGVIFPNKADAQWTLTGRGESDGLGDPTIGEAFRECYDEKLAMIGITV